MWSAPWAAHAIRRVQDIVRVRAGVVEQIWAVLRAGLVSYSINVCIIIVIISNSVMSISLL